MGNIILKISYYGNYNKYNPHKPKLLGFSVICKNIKRS